MQRKIIHIDMDAFYASVEQRENPELRGRPVAVGGSRRGVVMAASYEARAFGVRSAMPSGLALRKCPDLIFVPPNFEIYRDVSQRVRAIFRSYTDLVEPVSIDEAYLDVTDARRGPPSATLLARAIKQDILDATRLTASAGVSFNKFLAKTASAMNKPDGLTVILPEDAPGLLAGLPIERFHGIGPATAKRMRSLAIGNGADLLLRTEEELVRDFGRVGRYYYRMVRGLDERLVRTDRQRKSFGAERTFENDVADLQELMMRLESVVKEMGRRMQSVAVCGRTVTLKIKYHDFTISTRSRTVRHGVSTAGELRTIGRELLQQPAPPGRAVRLIGLTLSNLVTPQDAGAAQLELEFEWP
ncbi:MAG TPA: DNA polymerase IV [Candidatus Kapabacteria bacterium]|nr:DNA polymerase IV [Candidatus Kapabacteria bacterium]